ncbi:T9SS type A sorting domain-containing protein [Geofilum sp. OHC36d9]|uniref:T9SS type A sorting domain-containing protein n=1 Tax=Geofilum sp. OHC36d9 TaxID=3458413 RepID=UPI0040332236
MKRRFICVLMASFIWLLMGVALNAQSSFISAAPVDSVSVNYDSGTGNIVVSSDHLKTAIIRVYDLTGKEVYKSRVDSFYGTAIVPAYYLRKGVFLVHVTSDQWIKPLTYKILVR